MIELRSVTKSFERVPALREVSLVVPEGRSLAVVGHSGSGKTTLLRLIAGLDIPDAGEVALAGEMVSRPGWALPAHRRRIGFVFQATSLWPHMTVVENVLFGLAGRSREARASRLAAVFAATGIQDLADRYPAQLSGGEARRVEIARAIAPEPRLLLMDEPLTNLDALSRAELLQAIAGAIAAHRCTLVLVTHDPVEARGLVQRVVELQAGRLFADAPA